MSKEDLINSLIPKDLIDNKDLNDTCQWNYKFDYEVYSSLIKALSEFGFNDYKIDSLGLGTFIYHIHDYEEDPMNEYYGFNQVSLPNRLTYYNENGEMPDGQVIFIPKLRKGEVIINNCDIFRQLVMEKCKRFIILNKNEFLVLRYEGREYATSEVNIDGKIHKIHHPVHQIWVDKYKNKYSMEITGDGEDDLIIFKYLENDKDECDESIRSGIDHESD